MIPTKFQDDREKLLGIWRKLGGEDRHALLSFARFLLSQGAGEGGGEPLEAVEPVLLPRPPGPESAVQALKRLKRSYPMLEADQHFLVAAAGILQERVMGAPDGEVVARLEAFFAERYAAWRVARGGG